MKRASHAVSITQNEEKAWRWRWLKHYFRNTEQRKECNCIRNEEHICSSKSSKKSLKKGEPMLMLRFFHPVRQFEQKEMWVSHFSCCRALVTVEFHCLTDSITSILREVVGKTVFWFQLNKLIKKVSTNSDYNGGYYHHMRLAVIDFDSSHCCCSQTFSPLRRPHSSVARNTY